MSAGKSVALNSFFQELFQAGIYKRTQGRMTRQLTCVAVWVAFGLAAYRLYDTNTVTLWKYWIPALLLAVGFWGGYRLVNYSQFADFLIGVEAELNKVSWPSWPELIRSSTVVVVMIIALAVILYGFDAVWTFLFRFLGVIA